MNILITGGSGFIGTRLVKKLLSLGHHVAIYDKRISDRFPEITIEGDVRDADHLQKSTTDIGMIYHLAAEHQDNVRPVSLYYDVNKEGTKNIINAARINRVPSILFTSTVALYGLNVGIPHEEDPISPFNDYGQSKYLAEKELLHWIKEDEDKRFLTIVRPVVIFGEGNRGNVYNLIKQIASGTFFLVGDGKNKKSMGYVENLCHFLVRFTNPQSPGVQIFNYADQPDLKTSELVQIVSQSMGRSKKPFRLPYYIGLMGGYFFDLLSLLTRRTFPISSVRIKKFCASTQVSAEKLKRSGFVQPYSLREGLEKMIQKEFLERSMMHP